LEKDLPLFEAKNVDVLALAVQNQADAKNMADQTQVTFPILADSNHQVTDAYQIYNLLGDGVAAPAVFVIDQTGQIVWSYIGKDYSDRPTNEMILANVP
jgi:peroxiredoxin